MRTEGCSSATVWHGMRPMPTSPARSRSGLTEQCEGCEDDPRWKALNQMWELKHEREQAAELAMLPEEQAAEQATLAPPSEPKRLAAAKQRTEAKRSS